MNLMIALHLLLWLPSCTLAIAIIGQGSGEQKDVSRNVYRSEWHKTIQPGKYTSFNYSEWKTSTSQTQEKNSYGGSFYVMAKKWSIDETKRKEKLNSIKIRPLTKDGVTAPSKRTTPRTRTLYRNGITRKSNDTQRRNIFTEILNMSHEKHGKSRNTPLRSVIKRHAPVPMHRSPHNMHSHRANVTLGHLLERLLLNLKSPNNLQTTATPTAQPSSLSALQGLQVLTRILGTVGAVPSNGVANPGLLADILAKATQTPTGPSTAPQSTAAPTPMPVDLAMEHFAEMMEQMTTNPASQMNNPMMANVMKSLGHSPMSMRAAMSPFSQMGFDFPSPFSHGFGPSDVGMGPPNPIPDFPMPMLPFGFPSFDYQSPDYANSPYMDTQSSPNRNDPTSLRHQLQTYRQTLGLGTNSDSVMNSIIKIGLQNPQLSISDLVTRLTSATNLLRSNIKNAPPPSQQNTRAYFEKLLSAIEDIRLSLNSSSRRPVEKPLQSVFKPERRREPTKFITILNQPEPANMPIRGIGTVPSLPIVPNPPIVPPSVNVDETFKPPSYSYGSSSTGPAMWHLLDHTTISCYTRDSNDRQSPINIRLRTVLTDNGKTSIRYNGTKSTLRAKFKNDGRVPSLEFISSDRILTGVPPHTLDQYILTSLNLHVGRDITSGSEHTVNNRHLQGEIQYVHYNKKYKNVDDAVRHTDGVVVLASFLQEVDNVSSMRLQPIFYNARFIKYPGYSVTISLIFDDLLPRTSLDKFVYYRGSLTTPPCSRGVTWLLLAEPIPVSTIQLYRLRSLYTEKGGNTTLGYHGNARPLQPINGRAIRSNFRIL